MTEDRKKELSERFLREELSEKEAAELSDALEEDEDFAGQLDFDLKLSAAMRHERMKNLEAEYQRGRGKARRKNLLRAGFLVLLLIIVGYAVYRAMDGDKLPFTPQEGREMMEDIIAANERKKIIGVTAGDEDWRSPLMKMDYSAAIEALRSQMVGKQPCQDPVVSYFAGNIEFYVNRTPQAAATFFNCALITNRFAEELELTRILLELSEGNLEEARDLFTATGWPLDTLPSKARYLVE